MARFWRRYFIPSWTISALKIWISPIRGLYDRTNIAAAMYVSDYLSLPAMGTIRLAWLLALGKVTVAAFFLVFLLLVIRAAIRKKAEPTRRWPSALGLGAFISMVSLIAASKVGELAALRLHASKSLLLIGAAILLIVDTDPAAVSSREEQLRLRRITVICRAAPIPERRQPLP